MTSTEAQTGGVREAGRIVRLGRVAPKVKPEADLNKIVSTLRFSLPLMRAAATDGYLRNLLLSNMILMNVREGKAIVMPDGALIH